MSKKLNKDNLESLYERLNRREFVHPDPLEFLYDYPEKRDREIVGLIASALAYGRVTQILKAVSSVLKPMGSSPYYFLKKTSTRSFNQIYSGFKHRFTTGEEVAQLLCNIKKVIGNFGSLEECFSSGLKEKDRSIFTALCSFSKNLGLGKNGNYNSLVPSPELGSACKRLNLFLRWMVRSDDVDPGGWDGIPKSKLIVPIDTHMHKISIALGFTERKNADMRTAIEITNSFKTFCPKDPVRYDFAITRLGINGNLPKEVINDLGLGHIY